MKRFTLALIALAAVVVLVAAAPYDTRKFSDRYLLEKLNSDVGAITGVPATRVLTVDTAAVPVAGKVYTTIAAAITYIGTQTHDATHPWVINAGSTVNTTAASDLPTYTRMTSYLGTIANTEDQTMGSVNGDSYVTGTKVTLTGKVIMSVQDVTTADSGDGSAAAATITPSASTVTGTCSDSDGCDWTLSETGAVSGQRVTFINIGTNVINFADTSGVSETAGAFAAGANDSISFVYANSRWIETGRSNN